MTKHTEIIADQAATKPLEYTVGNDRAVSRIHALYMELCLIRGLQRLRGKGRMPGKRCCDVNQKLSEADLFGVRMRDRICTALRDGDMTIPEVSEILGEKMQSVSGYMQQAHKEGRVNKVGLKKPSGAHRGIIIWGLPR